MIQNLDEKKVATRNIKVNDLRNKLKLNPLISQRKNHMLQKLQKCTLEQQSIEAENNNMACSFFESGKFTSSLKFGQVHGSFERKYKITEKIGQGAHGVVKKCISLKTNKQYAVKVLKMDDQQIAHLKKNFINIQSLEHQNIIKYKGMYFDEKKSTCYLLMEYFPFPSLLQIPSISPQQLKLITKQIIETLIYLHKNKICHRDIKPENVLYDSTSGKIKVIDFGISKYVVERGTQVNMFTNTGTLYYKAPEMFLGGGYDEKVDMWALGATVYKIVTKRTPFQSTYHNETIKNILNGNVQIQDQIWQKYGFGKDLVSRLLKPSAKRLSAEQARNHIWFDPSSSKEKDCVNSMLFLQNNQGMFNSIQEFLKNKSQNMKPQKYIDIKKEMKMQSWFKQEYIEMDLTDSLELK